MITSLHEALVGILNGEIPCFATEFVGKKFTFSVRSPLAEDKTACRKYLRIGYSVPKSRYNSKGFRRDEIPVFDAENDIQYIEAEIRHIMRKASGIKPVGECDW